MDPSVCHHPLPRAVLLDLDDTILDDSRNVGDCWRQAISAHRAEIGPADPDTLYETIRTTARWYWADAERHRVGRLDLPASRREVVRIAVGKLGIAPDLADKVAAHYGSARDQGVEPLDEAIETVRWLRGRGCRLALLTNGAASAQRSKIARFDLAGYFDRILIEGELGFGKPDLRVYRMALNDLDVAPEDAWMVGDNLEWDVAAPQSLGIFGVWIDAQGSGLPAEHNVRPNHIVRRLSELRDLWPVEAT